MVVEQEESTAPNRGFVTAKLESGKLGDGQWVSSGPQEQVKEEEVRLDSSSLPTVSVEEEGGARDVLRMYWLDAHEDPYKHPGTVWLFGKVAVAPKTFVSCCVTVKNVPKRIYLAKREVNSKTGEPVTGVDLYNEFNTKVAKRYKITDFKCRPVEKSYAFEHADIPNHGTYLEVVYGPQFPALPPDLVGETFCRVFGTPQTSSERELLSLLLLKIQKLDPDVIIGHDVGCFDLEVLTHRMVVNKIPHWSRLGRLRRSNQAELGKKALEKQATVGRLVADLKISAKELIRCKSYELGALAEKCLKAGDEEKRQPLDPDTLRKAYGRSEDLKQAINLCMRDADRKSVV